MHELSSKLEVLSIDRRRIQKPIEPVKASMDLINVEETGEENKFSAPEYESAGSSLSCSSDRSDSLDVAKNFTQSDTMVQSNQHDDMQSKSSKIESISATYGVNVIKGLETKRNDFKMENMGQSLVGSNSEEKWNSMSEGVSMDQPQSPSKHDKRVKNYDNRRGDGKSGHRREYTVSKISKGSDEDECVILSGQQVVTERVRQEKKLKNYDKHFIPNTVSDECDYAITENENSIIMTGPKGTYKLAGKIANMLYPHQRDGLKWLWSLHCKGKGGILGDDMGLGKTMQVIRMCCYFYINV